MGKKLTNLNRYISVITDIDKKWLVIFLRAIINHLSFGDVHLPQFEYHFSCFVSFFFFFFFCRYLLLNRETHLLKVTSIEDIWEDFYATEIGVPGWGILLNRVL